MNLKNHVECSECGCLTVNYKQLCSIVETTTEFRITGFFKTGLPELITLERIKKIYICKGCLDAKIVKENFEKEIELQKDLFQEFKKETDMYVNDLLKLNDKTIDKLYELEDIIKTKPKKIIKEKSKR